MKLDRMLIYAILNLCSVALVLGALVRPLCAQAAPFALFGPEKFTREVGTPDTFSRSFAACNTEATYRLVVENGAAGRDRVSSATLQLNGVEVVRSSDLNQRVERFEKEVTLQGDNTLAVRLASNPGGYLTVSIYCVSGCLDVSITSPAAGSTLNRSKALVQGSLVNSTGETGVVLSSVVKDVEEVELPQVQGNFFAGLILLQPGDNILAVTATDACGYKVRKEINVHADAAQERVKLSASPDNGVLPAGVATFDVTLEAETNLPSAVRYDWDFDGDGIVEQSGSSLTKTVARYQTPGIYLPSVIVTDAQGNSYKDTALISVIGQQELDTHLKGKWEGMKSALAKGDVAGTLKFFSATTRDSYEKQFKALASYLPQIAADFGNAAFVRMNQNTAVYDLRTVRDGVTYSFQLLFVRDSDGLWKIRNF